MRPKLMFLAVRSALRELGRLYREPGARVRVLR